jgi:UDP-N-acetylglucosamine--N-acetylmuramyl-(pentapeptide) pyrophosphoryl-undecaprenol N-acetylglucosamine transferase
LTIVLAGGGSGGHITPILAVAAELKHLSPSTKIIYIGQKGDDLGQLPAKDPNIDEVYEIYAGKFRRFHGEGFKQFLDIPTFMKNTRDFFYVFLGTIQSRKLMKQLSPDILFTRGGYVSVPAAFGARMNGVAYITHDSDPIPSLANRIIARWASFHAVALPKEIYPYPANKTITTGIPVSSHFVSLNKSLIKQYRRSINVPEEAKLLFIIGGGLGSQTVNKAIVSVVPHLIREFPDLYVMHGTGKVNEASVKEAYLSQLSESEQARVKAFGYLDDVFRYSGAADLIITRAGATNLAEFAIQGKACIVIPSSFLTGGHQLKSADYLVEQAAAVVVNEADLKIDANKLARQISSLLHDPSECHRLGANLSKLAKPNATNELANLILDVGAKNEIEKV